ncbi:MAG TPA: hypothetical protein PK156_12435 [Polyangium sp.]|nr:hypothetical protein [Polyangium sp.]
MKRFASLVAVGLGLASTPCFAQEDAPEPRYPPFSVRPKLIAGGLGLFALSYGTGFLVSELDPSQPGIAKLQIPVVGPWMAIPENKCVEYASTDCTPELVGRAFVYSVAGLMQLGGLALVTQAIVMKTQATAAPKPPEETAFIAPIPIVSPNLVGVGLVGRF